jgi:hypothetical protein
MRKYLVIATALTLCVALCGSFALANVKKVKTKVSINFAAGDDATTYTPATPDVFSGGLSAKKGCKKGRKITLNGPATGSVKSNKDGTWSISVNNAPTGAYTATAAKRKFKKKHGKVVCKKGTSPSITAQ